VETQRLLGKLQATARIVGPQDLKKLVAEKFAAVARGEGGPSILFVVKSNAGDIVMTESQPAENARVPRTREDRPELLQEKARVESKFNAAAERKSLRLAQQTPRGTVGLKVRSAGMVLPTGIGALRGEDIATVDISKHAAGVLAPNAVSIVTIVLKPGATVPQ
jgi:hypothetical protein